MHQMYFRKVSGCRKLYTRVQENICACFFPVLTGQASDVETCCSVLLSVEMRGRCFSSLIPQAVQLSSMMQIPVLHCSCISKATFIWLSAGFIKDITNITEQALDNFRFFSISCMFGKMQVKGLSYDKARCCVLFFIINVDTVVLFSIFRSKCSGCEGRQTNKQVKCLGQEGVKTDCE